VEARLLLERTALVIEPFESRPAAAWDQVERAVAEIVQKARRTVIEQYRCKEASLQIEFLMPDPFFVKAPDEFKLRWGRNPVAIGRVHPVVIRWRARLLDLTVPLEPWYASGARIDRKSPGRIRWLEQPECRGASSFCESCHGLVVLRFSPTDEFYDVIDAGFPFVAWLRAQPPNDDWDAFVQEFEQWAARHPLEMLPRELLVMRQRATNIGANLTLFWDDPEYADHWTRGDVLTS
jgi:hypothetical protein